MTSQKETLPLMCKTIIILLIFLSIFAPCKANCPEVGPCYTVPKGHGEYCSSSTECQQMFSCVSYVGSSKYCLCVPDFFYTGRACASIDLFLAQNPVVSNRTKSSIALTWTVSTAYSVGLTFQIRIDDGQRVPASSVGAIVTNLEPGIQYNLAIITVVNGDGYYSNQETAIGITASTLKGNGQPCTLSSECDPSLVCVDYLNKGSKYCLCNGTSYFTQTNGCSEIRQLQVRNVTVENRTTSSISLRWATNALNQTNVTYLIQTDSGRYVSANTSGGAVSSLSAGTQYNLTIFSKLAGDNVYPSLNTSVAFTAWTLSGHGGRCSIPNPICESATTCVNSVCLCHSAEYRSDKNQCVDLTNLLVTNVTRIIGTHDIIFTWSNINVNRVDATYAIVATDTGRKAANASGGTFANLTPGSSYNFVITTTLPAGVYYREENASVYLQSIWTNPAQPGRIRNVALLSENTTSDQYGYRLEFGPSEGLVAAYQLTLTNSNGDLVEQREAKSASFVVVTLKPAQTYNYSICATNGAGVVSVVTSGTFSTPFSVSNGVSYLTIDDITEYNAFVKWLRPSRPNGDIIGYVATLKDVEDNCVGVYKISCRNCNTATSLIEPGSCALATTSEKIYDHDNLNDASFPVTVVYAGLSPFHNYTTVISPYNDAGKGLNTTLTFKTKIAAANKLKSLSAAPTRSSDNRVGLLIAWTPGDFTGPTNYTVILERKGNLTDDVFVPVINVNVSNYETNNITFSDLLAYWEYRVTVTAFTIVGYSNAVSVVNRTLMTAPGVPSFQFERDPSVALDINITIACPSEKERNGTIIGYIILKKPMSADLNTVEKEEIQDTRYNFRSCDELYSIPLTNLLLERNYSILVKTVNRQFEGDYSSMKQLFIMAKVPILDMDAARQKIIEVSNPTETTVEAKLCKRCLTDQKQGKINDLLLLVCAENSYCLSSKERKRSTNAVLNYKTWSMAKKYVFSVGYRVTPKHWLDQLMGSEGDFVNYVIGNDTSCKSDDDDYCNGPLPTGLKLKIVVVVCNTAGCSEASSEYITTQEKDNRPSSIGLGIGIGLGALLLVVITVVIVVVKCKQRKHRKNDSKPVKTVENIYNASERTYQDDHQYGVTVAENQISLSNVKKAAKIDNVYDEVPYYSN